MLLSWTKLCIWSDYNNVYYYEWKGIILCAHHGVEWSSGNHINTMDVSNRVSKWHSGYHASGSDITGDARGGNVFFGTGVQYTNRRFLE